MSTTQIEAAGERLLASSLNDPLALARAIKEGDVVSLAGAARIASCGLPVSVALTDPARFWAMRRATAAYHSRGYGILDPVTLLIEARQILGGRKGG